LNSVRVIKTGYGTGETNRDWTGRFSDVTKGEREYAALNALAISHVHLKMRTMGRICSTIGHLLEKFSRGGCGFYSSVNKNLGRGMHLHCPTAYLSQLYKERRPPSPRCTWKELGSLFR